MTAARTGVKPMALLVAALLGAPGCMRHYIVSVDELRKLDGYDARYRRPRELVTNEGNVIPFDAQTELWLLGPEPEVRGYFRAVKLTPDVFEGVRKGTDEVLRADLAAVHFARVQGVDGAQSLALAGTIVGAATAVIYAFLITRPPPVF